MFRHDSETMQSVTVRAHGSSANLGPGFDCFAVALDAVYDEVTVSQSDTDTIEISATGEKIPVDPNRNTAGIVAAEFLKGFGITSGLKIQIVKGVKPGYGLGSSGASSAAAAFALCTLFGKSLARPNLVELASKGELASAGIAHRDNVAASLYGGFTMWIEGPPQRVISIPPPDDLHFAVAVPLIEVPEMKTKEARTVLPASVDFGRHVRNTASASQIVAGFMLRDTRILAEGMRDEIVEPVRSKFIPGYVSVRRAALATGALGFTISGAGPSLLAACNEEQIAVSVLNEMRAAFESEGIASEGFVSKVGPGCSVIR